MFSCRVYLFLNVRSYNNIGYFILSLYRNVEYFILSLYSIPLKIVSSVCLFFYVTVLFYDVCIDLH